MADFTIEWEHWPVLVCDLRTEMKADMLELYRTEIAKALARQEPFASVFLSLTPGHKFDRKLLKPMADFTNSNRSELARYCLGTAIVLGSPAYRFMLTSFFLLTKTAIPMDVFAAAEPARVWVEGLLAKAGLKPPPGLAMQLAA